MVYPGGARIVKDLKPIVGTLNSVAPWLHLAINLVDIKGYLSNMMMAVRHVIVYFRTQASRLSY